MARRRSARFVPPNDTSGEEDQASKRASTLVVEPTENSIRVVSGATLTSGITTSKANLLDEGIQTLDMDWEMPDEDPQDSPKKIRAKPKSSRFESLAQAASGASGALGSTVSALGKRSRNAFESGKEKLHGLQGKKPSKSRLAQELEEFLPDPDPIPDEIGPVKTGPNKKPRPKLPKGWSYVLPEEPPAKKARLSAADDEETEKPQVKPETTAKTPKPVAKTKKRRAKDKRWESQGLYAGQDRSFNPKLTEAQNKLKRQSIGSNKENTVLPLPMFRGEELLTTDNKHRDFVLPFDVFQPIDPREPKPQKGDWQKLKSNKFFGDAASEWRHTKLAPSLCMCARLGQTCDHRCLNFQMQYECDDDNCAIGAENCNNRAFATLQQRSKGNRYEVGVDLMQTYGKGFGVQALRTFDEDQIIVEYAGEIITKDECERRMLNEYKDAECYYLMEWNQSMVIDATRGSIARFVNHSCDPNCTMDQWHVSGKPRMALFAKREIMTGEELTYDYNFSPFSNDNVQTCHCGSSNCRGVIGPKMTKEKERQLQQQNGKSSGSGLLAGTKRKLAALLTGGSTSDKSKMTRTDKPASNVVRKKPRLTEPEIPPRSTSVRRPAPAREAPASRIASASTGNTTLVGDDEQDPVDRSSKQNTRRRARSASDTDVVIRDSARPVPLQQPKADAPQRAKKHKRRLSGGDVLDRALDGAKKGAKNLQRRRTVGGRGAIKASSTNEARSDMFDEAEPLVEHGGLEVSQSVGSLTHAIPPTATATKPLDFEPLRPVIDWRTTTNFNEEPTPSSSSTMRRKMTTEITISPSGGIYNDEIINDSDSSTDMPARPVPAKAVAARKALQAERQSTSTSTKKVKAQESAPNELFSRINALRKALLPESKPDDLTKEQKSITQFFKPSPAKPLTSKAAGV